MALFEQKEPLTGIVFWPQNGGYYYHTKREEEPASVLNGAIHKIDLFLFDSGFVIIKQTSTQSLYSLYFKIF